MEALQNSTTTKILPSRNGFFQVLFAGRGAVRRISRSFSIVPVEISEEHRNLLEEFKKNISDVLEPIHTDAYLMKWLRAGNFNLNKCELLFRESLWCWAAYDLGNYKSVLETEETTDLKQYEFWSPLGFAKDGTPVSYLALGRGDYKGNVYSLCTIQICLYCSHCVEYDIVRARDQSKKINKEINEITYIIDMEGFHLKKLFHTCVFETAFNLFWILQEQRPEVWKQILIVNAAFYVYQAFNVVKPMFRDSLIRSMRVVSKDDTPSLLLKYIDEDVLPAFLGGTRVDSKGDPMCSEFLKFGGTVPEKYYSRNKPLLQPTEPGVKTVTIRARSCYNYTLIVREPNSRLSFEVRTEGGSIGGPIFYRAFGPNPNVLDLPESDEHLDSHNPKCNVILISPTIKLQTHISQTASSCIAPKPGLYIFMFDNSSSWVASRKVIFRIKVLPPL